MCQCFVGPDLHVHHIWNARHPGSVMTKPPGAACVENALHSLQNFSDSLMQSMMCAKFNKMAQVMETQKFIDLFMPRGTMELE